MGIYGEVLGSNGARRAKKFKILSDIGKKRYRFINTRIECNPETLFPRTFVLIEEFGRPFSCGVR